jgi:site-specific DNA-methyltransferase (adenine-specific)
MAELIWKGKYHADKQSVVNSSNSHTQPFHTLESFSVPLYSESWHNRLIHGDKCKVLPALLPEFIGKVNLIYIDPPFMTGRTFTSGTELRITINGIIIWMLIYNGYTKLL